MLSHWVPVWKCCLGIQIGNMALGKSWSQVETSDTEWLFLCHVDSHYKAKPHWGMMPLELRKKTVGIIWIMEMNTLSSLLTPVRTVVSIIFWRSWLTGTRVLLRNFGGSGFQRNMMSAPAFSWGLWEERLGSWRELTKLIGFWALSDVPRALPNDLYIWS